MITTMAVNAQVSHKKNEAPKATEEEDGPVMFKFEPNFLHHNEKRKAEIAHTRSIIDTLDIPERKRLKLLRDLYKNGVSKRLQKALLVKNTYEDIEE
ncbi:MAG: hypothetical protein ABJN95_12830 [Maribacter sp.]|uniref:hypothetical protein n=1 Tax=Maribacter sp. TaxID=1897614 RepID=UPI003299197B